MADQAPAPLLPPLNTTPSQQGNNIVLNPPGISIGGGDEGVSSKQMMIGGGAFIALAIILFFIRNAFVGYLVGSLKRSPNNAGLAGWGLYGGLLFSGAILSLRLVSESYLSMLSIGLLGGLASACFLLTILVAAKK